MQISQLPMVQIGKFQCLSHREFPEFFKTHPTLICRSIVQASRSLQTNRQCYSIALVALLKCDFLRVPCTESWTSWAQMKAENLRNSKMGLHVPIAASKLELLASKRNRAFFLGHPVCLKMYTKSVLTEQIYKKKQFLKYKCTQN